MNIVNDSDNLTESELQELKALVGLSKAARYIWVFFAGIASVFGVSQLAEVIAKFTHK